MPIQETEASYKLKEIATLLLKEKMQNFCFGECVQTLPGTAYSPSN